MTRKHHLALVGTMVLLALAPVRADANTFVCAAEDVSCLIQAINDANANGHPRNTIHLAPGTYTLTSVDNNTDGPNGLPSITSTLKIEGASNEMITITRAAAAPSFRLFHVAIGGHLILQSVTVSNGAAAFGNLHEGGGLFNNGGVVTIRASVFIGNSGIPGEGGGLSNLGGKVTIRNSAFTGNFAFGGGGLVNEGGDVTIVDSIFDSNFVNFDGGALLNGFDGVLRIKRSHITRNGGGSAGGIVNGGVTIGGGTLLIDETTFAGNTGEIAGAINVRRGTLAVTDSAFVENAVGLLSGGPAILTSGTAAVTNTTFARNRIERFATGGALAISNGGILVLTNDTFADHTGRFFEPILFSAASATTILVNTILTHNPGDATVQDCRGPVISLGHNLISDPSGCAITLQPGDLTGDAGLDAFTDDGTPGDGHFPLLKDSQAVDAGNIAFCSRRDQIGQLRRGQCDIGAIEFRVKRLGHHGWNDVDHDEREDSWSGNLLDEGVDQPNNRVKSEQPIR